MNLNKLILTIIFACFTISLSAQISINHNGSLNELFYKLSSRYGYKFMYSNDDINDRAKISINVTNYKFDEIMKEVGNKLGFDFTVKNKQVVLKNRKKSVEKIAAPNNIKNPEVKKTEEPQPTIISEVKKTETQDTEPEPIDKPDNIAKQIITEQEPEIVKKTEEPEQAYKPEPQPIPTKADIGKFALHTNLLYDLALTPNIGIEYALNEKLSFVINGLWAHINWENGNKTYRTWLLSPEVRYKFNENLYAGLMAHTGSVNLKLSDTGRQGNALGGGIIGGYLLEIAPKFKLDFGIGLGVTHFKYDAYSRIGHADIKNTTGVVKYLWGPTKASVTLIWEIN